MEPPPEPMPEPAPEPSSGWQPPAEEHTQIIPAAESTQVMSPIQSPPSDQPPVPAWGAPADQGATTVMPAWQAGAAAPATTGAPPVGDTMPLPGPPEGATGAELMIESGPDTGQTFKAGSGTARIGRSPDNDLILRDPATSGHHARLERRGSQFFIVDLGSTNGTLVNGEPVQEKELKHNDRITIGQNAVKFSLV